MVTGSHPVWVCGLKLYVSDMQAVVVWSHPVWVCGLKLLNLIRHVILNLVTPCMGVWIETDVTLLNRLSDMSHPVWVCGLKPTMCRT